MGEIPVTMLQLAQIDWSKNGASVKLIGEWYFEKKLAITGIKTGNKKVFVKCL